MVSFGWFICSFVKTRRVMFLLNDLYKYFAMNTSFRVSLLYLLLIIPQHGNSPLPVMQSWLHKDQDDGFVQREMTSSLTGGDESFGSAHQTYQNSLVRKKKADTTGNLLPSIGYRKFASKYDRSQLYQQPNPFFDGRYVNQDFSPSVVDNQKSNGIFEDFDSDLGLSSDKYHAKTANLRMDDPSVEALSPHFKDDLTLLNNRLSLRAENEKNLNPVNEDYDSGPSWSMCKRLKDSYPPNNLLGMPQSPEIRESVNLPLENPYSAIEGERSREVRNQEFRDTNTPEGKSPQVFDENEYYDTGSNSLIGNENEYNQMSNNHAYMHKREETQLANRNKVGTSEAAKVVLDALRSSEAGGAFNEESFPLESEQENKDNAQIIRASNTNAENSNRNSLSDTNLVWKLNSDLQSQALNNVMRNSQKALQEVQQFQRELYYNPQDGNENEGLKRESGNQPQMKYKGKIKNFDEKRLKREDEDEQKNMKTGTDEGGGGEYEDEEGKGHKDEEEYYEEADLSDDEPGTEVRTTDELGQKYVKREVPEDKNSKEEQGDNNSQDYELNLENAPVENAEKSRKSSYREGEKTKNKSVRKGVKIWDQWGKWSPCSVTCGVGRSTRWRHCIGGGCAQGEKEAQIKRCTNPAC